MKTNKIKTCDHFRDLTKMVLVLFALTVFVGCKPQQIITEKEVTKVDSTETSFLKEEIKVKDIRISVLESDLNNIREENVSLSREVSSHVINYNTGAQINPETGKYPIANETITQSKSFLEKTIKENERLITKQSDSIQSLNNYVGTLKTEVNTLKKENKDLKEKATANTGLNLRLLIFGLSFGAIIALIIRYFIKKKFN